MGEKSGVGNPFSLLLLLFFPIDFSHSFHSLSLNILETDEFVSDAASPNTPRTAVIGRDLRMSAPGDYEAVRKDIAAQLKKPGYDDGSAGPVFVRLAW